MKVVINRSALRMWLLAMGGIPLVIISLDVLTQRRISNWLRDALFQPQDTQLFEPRDVIWAVVMLIVGLVFVGWGLKELFLPTKVLECLPQGLAVRVAGPFRPPAIVPWAYIHDVRPGTVEDEGDRLPVLELVLRDATSLPTDPWGARWTGEVTLAVLVADWSVTPEEVVKRIYAYVDALVASRRETGA